MIGTDLWRYIALLTFLLLAALWLLLAGNSVRARVARRARASGACLHAATVPGSSPSVRQKLIRRVATLGDWIPVVQAAERAKLAAQLAHAGFRDQRAIAAVSGLKVVVGACFAGGAILPGAHLPVIGEMFFFRMLIVAGGFVIGMMLPEYAIRIVASRRRKAIAAALPDALDLLVICTNAGNSLIVAIRRVATELETICPPLADELSLTADELSIGGESARALNAMATRVGLSSMRALVATLTQSQKYGTPITQSLRTLSRTERTMQMVALEEKAAKLAPKMTLPMMIFIMPTVALVAAGPAVIQLLAVFRQP